jgi:hypothetical protein
MVEIGEEVQNLLSLIERADEHSNSIAYTELRKRVEKLERYVSAFLNDTP